MPPVERKLETAEECRANLPQAAAHLAMYDMLWEKSQLTLFQAMFYVLQIACGVGPEHTPVWQPQAQEAS